MLNPKEKAKELVDKIYYDIDFDLVGMPNTKKMVAKQCALIAVDEIIESNPMIKYGESDAGTEYKSNDNYWYEVKEELENNKNYDN